MSILTNSVIICTRNRLADIQQCLLSLAQQTLQPEEIIVVDSSDKLLEDEVSFINIFNIGTFPNTKLMYKHTKAGLPYQRNVGVSLASGDIIYFFDDDVSLEKDYLATMHCSFVEHSTYGGGMGSITKVAPKRNNIDRFIRNIFFLQRDHASGSFTLSGMPTHAYGTGTFKRVQVLGGCCMAYRSFVFKKYTFDEQLNGYAYMEDCDMSARVAQDYLLFFNPNAKLTHTNSPVGRDNIIKNKAMFIKNYRYLFFKNFYPNNRLKIIAYYWSIVGLFIQALLLRDKQILWGYLQGLYAL